MSTQARRWAALLVVALAATAMSVVHLVATTSPAAAVDTEVLTETVPPQLTPWDTTLSFPQFDPSNGVLQSVDITATLNNEALTAVTNNVDNEPLIGSVTVNTTLDIFETPDTGVPPLQATASAATPELEVPPGETVETPASGSETVSVNVVEANLLDTFTGTGVVDFATRVTGNFSVSGNIPNAVVAVQNTAGVEMTLTYTFLVPAIDIEKATNGVDADEPPGPTAIVGAPVTFTYVVTNTGDIDLFNVVVTDDPEPESGITCPQDTLVVGESMTCEASQIATEGQYANTGTTVGEWNEQGDTVTDSDPSHHVGVLHQPAIDIEKLVNGDDADNPPGVIVSPGSVVTFTFVVTNTGNVGLVNVAVVDNVLGPITCPLDALASGESMQCTATAAAQTGEHANIATVTGESVFDGQQVTDQDPGHHYAAVVPAAPPAQPPPTPVPPPQPPPTPVPPTPPPVPELPRTGSETFPIALVGAGLTVLGMAASLCSRRVRAKLPIFGRDTPWDWAAEDKH